MSVEKGEDYLKINKKRRSKYNKPTQWKYGGVVIVGEIKTFCNWVENNKVEYEYSNRT